MKNILIKSTIYKINTMKTLKCNYKIYKLHRI